MIVHKTMSKDSKEICSLPILALTVRTILPSNYQIQMGSSRNGHQHALSIPALHCMAQQCDPRPSQSISQTSDIDVGSQDAPPHLHCY
jgi:hypothetical protein